ncbi:MAG: hypothetical protein PHP00_02190 [Thiotrichaceae bacterium]|nr:hypothetical protein [Thiotrichaceae bacterium]
MSQIKSPLAKILDRIKQNPVIASVLTLLTVITALSAFTEASQHLWDMIPDTRPNLNGTWIAEVKYDWQNKPFQEIFIFNDMGDKIMGTASFLQVQRAISEGKLQKNKLTFITKTQEEIGSTGMKETTHLYRGEIQQNQIIFMMQTEGGFSSHLPIEFVAKRQ